MAVSSIKFKITADMQELKKSMADATKAINDTASSAKSTGGIFSTMAGGLKNMAKGAANAVGNLVNLAARLTVFKAVNATFNTIGDSIQSAFNRADTMQTFEKAMTRITGSADEAGKAVAQVTDIVMGTPYGLDVAAKAVQGFANSNIEVGDSIKFVKGWGDAVAAYGDGSNDTLQRVTFQLTQMAAKGKVNLGDLNSAMEAGIPVLQIYAKASGKSLDEVRTSISDASIDTVDFFNVMNDAFMNGTDGFASVAGAAKDAGDLWKGTFDNMRAATTRGVLAILDAIDAGLVGAGLPTIKEAIAQYGKTLENGMKDLAPKIAPAIQAIADKFNELKPMIDAVWGAFTTLASEVGGKLVTAFGQAGGSLSGVFETFANFITTNMPTISSVIGTAIDIATGVFLGLGDTIQGLMPYLQTLMDIFKGVMEGISGMVPEGKTLTDVVREWTPVLIKAFIAFKSLKLGIKAVNGVISGFKKIVTVVDTVRQVSAAVKGSRVAFNMLSPVLKVVASSFKVVGTVFSAVGGVILTVVKAIGAAIVANPIAAAIIAVIAVLVLLYTKCEWFRDGVNAVWNAVKDAFFTSIDWISGKLSEFGTAVQNIWNNVKKWFSDAGDAIGEAMDKAAEWCRKAGETISNVWDSIVNAFKVAGEFIANIVTFAFMLVYEIISGVLTIISAVITTVLDTIRYIWEITWAVISEFFMNIWNSIVEWITPILETLAEFFSTVWQGIKDVAVIVWEAIRDFFINIWNSIVEFMTPIIEGIATFISETWDKIKEVTSTVWEAIKQFFIDTWNAIVDAVTPIIQAIADFISTVWEGIKSITQTVWNAIKSIISSVWDAIKNAVSTAINWVSTTVSNVWNSIKAVTSSVWDAIKSVISSVWDNIKSAVKSAIDSVKSTVSNVWDSIKSVTSNAWNNIKDAIMKPINAARDAVEKAINAIKGFFSNLRIKFPDVPLPRIPKFSLSGEFSLNPPSVPHLEVGWFATGGIATGASVVGIGEAGDEAIVPLSNKSRMRPFAQAVSAMIKEDQSGSDNNSSGSGVLITDNTFIVRKESDISKIGQYLVNEADRKDLAKGKRDWGD